MTALIIVDVQNDFFPGGALPVKTAPEILPVLTKLLDHPFNLIVATKDWHPADHASFAAVHGKMPGERVMFKDVEQILWPIHCVQGSSGADFYPGWETKKIKKVFHKGTDKMIDSYSTFFDNRHEKDTGLAAYLQAHKIHTVYIVGLATDYCVKYSTLDALKLGFITYVITDGCRGVDIQPDDSQKALKEVERAGAHLIHSNDLLHNNLPQSQ